MGMFVRVIESKCINLIPLSWSNFKRIEDISISLTSMILEWLKDNTSTMEGTVKGKKSFSKKMVS